MHIRWGLLLFSPEPSPQRSLHAGAYCQGARFELSLLLKCWPLQSQDINAGRTAAKGFLQQTSQITIQRNFSEKKQQSPYFCPFIIYSSNHRMQGDGQHGNHQMNLLYKRELLHASHTGCTQTYSKETWACRLHFPTAALLYINTQKTKLVKSHLFAPPNKQTHTVAFKHFTFGDSTSIFGVGQGAEIPI